MFTTIRKNICKKLNIFKIFTFFIAFTLIFFSFSPFLSAYADAADDDKGLEDNMTFHVYDDVDLVSTLKFEYGKSRIVIKSVYPQLACETEREGVQAFNDLAMQIVSEQIKKFRNVVKDLAPIQSKMEKKSLTNNLYIDYNTSYIKSSHDHIISIRFSIQGNISGLKHPYHEYVTLNYDLDTNQSLELNDLFLPTVNYLELLSAYTADVLTKRLANKSMIAEGTAPTDINFQAWNIKPNGILITFNDNQVAPYGFGSQTVLVPYTMIKEFISPDSPMMDCVKHKDRCARHNLLTGGFIDEAVNTHHRPHSIISLNKAQTSHGRLYPILGKL